MKLLPWESSCDLAKTEFSIHRVDTHDKVEV
jgi:hypothetical protein